MSHVDLLDTTLRDGQQSLWGMRMQAGMALPVWLIRMLPVVCTPAACWDAV